MLTVLTLQLNVLHFIIIIISIIIIIITSDKGGGKCICLTVC